MEGLAYITHRKPKEMRDAGVKGYEREIHSWSDVSFNVVDEECKSIPVGYQ
jgi:hypothetical protein